MYFSLFVWVPSLSILRRVQSIFQGELLSCLSLWWVFCCWIWFRGVYLFFGVTLFFSFFIFIFLFISDGVCFQKFQVLSFYSKHSNSFLIWLFYFFYGFSFPTFYYHHDAPNYTPVSWLYILQNLQFFSSSYVHFYNYHYFRTNLQTLFIKFIILLLILTDIIFYFLSTTLG